MQTARAIQIRKTVPKDDDLFSGAQDIRNEFSLMPHLRVDRLSVDIGERRPSRGSERRPSQNMELKPRLNSITPVTSNISSPEEAIESDRDHSPSVWERFRRRKSDAGNAEHV